MDKTPGFSQIACRRAFCTGTGSSDQGQQNLPFNNTSHCRQTQFDFRNPVKVIRQPDESFLTLFNCLFPLPPQNSWTGFRLNSKVVMRVISTLRTQHSDLEGWRRLPKIKNHVGTTGARTSNLWELGCALRQNSGGFWRNSDKRPRTDRNRHRNVLLLT